MFSYTLLLVCITALIDKELAFDCKTGHLFPTTDPAHIVIQWKTFQVNQDPPCQTDFIVDINSTYLEYYVIRVYNHTQNAVSSENSQLFNCNVTSSVAVSPNWTVKVIVTGTDYAFIVREDDKITTECYNIKWMVYYHMGNLTYVAPPSNTEGE